ncbi:hypothetical protein DL239_19090 [Sedimentitalea sp. CY04]|uniref:Uncharacterized protein n=1 Tax=Parasedimentitalea denitrificans TaxID=2211118 RepID=A0ABX0WFG0_9RHOB|nr:hypothetical protein [Sedimentitalea sp. CY04]
MPIERYRLLKTIFFAGQLHLLLGPLSEHYYDSAILPKKQRAGDVSFVAKSKRFACCSQKDNKRYAA